MVCSKFQLVQVKPENMTQKCLVQICGLTLHPELNGQEVKVMGFDAGRYLCEGLKGLKVVTLKPQNAILKAGTCVRSLGC